MRLLTLEIEKMKNMLL